MFSLYYGTTLDEATAIAAPQAVGSQAYSLGQVDTDEGKNLGRPYTAVLAVNGDWLLNPPSGPHDLSAKMRALKFGGPDAPAPTVLSGSVPDTRPSQ